MRCFTAILFSVSQDAMDNRVFEQVKLTMPVLEVGGEKSFGPMQAAIMRHVATNVREGVVAGSGHWLMDERPTETVALIRELLASPHTAAAPTAGSDPGEKRIAPAEYKFPQHGNPGTGSSGVGGIETVVLKGDPDQGASTQSCSASRHTPRSRRIPIVMTGWPP